MTRLQKTLILLFLIPVFIFISVIVIYLTVSGSNKEFIYNTYGNIPRTDAAIVLGAKVGSDGGLTPMLQDRANVAIELFRNEKVGKILVSGDHGQKSYDEVNAVKKYLVKHDIPENVIFLDHAGFNTYDSMYRARDIFQIKSATVVTQNFHLPRAMFIARAMRINAYGISADKSNYGNTSYNYLREIPADAKASLELALHVKPKFLGEPIPITGEAKKSWD